MTNLIENYMFKFERKVDYFIIVHCGSRSFYLINTMASRRKSLEEENKLRVLRLLNDNPTITSREIAEKIYKFFKLRI